MGSRFTHATESRYAPIEGEALAVADALDKARHFVLGSKNMTITVDHRPLLKIFGDRSLEHICNPKGDLPALFAAKEVIGGAGAVFLKQPVTDTMFRPISGQACGFGFVEDIDSIMDLIDDG